MRGGVTQIKLLIRSVHFDILNNIFKQGPNILVEKFQPMPLTRLRRIQRKMESTLRGITGRVMSRVNMEKRRQTRGDDVIDCSTKELKLTR